jgi:drug/metabolite transporter (DMT)-like permease
MSIGVAIFLTLLASTATNVGLVLIKKGVCQAVAAGVQSGGLKRMVLHSRLARRGLFLQIGGYGIFFLAASSRSAPISVLQPLGAFGIVVVAFLAVMVLHERLLAGEWLGIGLLLVGVILLGSSAQRAAPHEAAIHVPRLLIYLGGIALLGLAALGCLRLCPQGKEEVPRGIMGGLLLGVGYLQTKTFSLAWLTDQHALLALGLAGIGIGMLGGQVLTIWNVSRCRASIIKALTAVTTQITVILGGWFCLGERFPQESSLLAARLAGFSAILAGTVILSMFSRTDPRHRLW